VDVAANSLNAISVTGVDDSNQLCNFSCVDENVTVAALATGVSAARGIDEYQRYRGTSFSAAITAGVVALMLCANRSLTVQQIKETLGTVGPIAHRTHLAKSLRALNAYSAVLAVR
jgi:subtilase family serine protease